MAQQKIFGITVGKADKPKTVEEIPLPTTNWKPSLPAINALPIALVEKNENTLLIKKFAVGAAAAVVATILLYVGSNIMDIVHDGEIKTLESESTALTVDIATLKPYQTYKDNIDSQMKTLYAQLKDDVDSSKVLEELTNKARDNGITLTDVSITALSGEAANSCPGTDPFDNTTVTVGCVSFTGDQPSDSPATSSFIDALQAQDGVTDVFISSYSNTGGTTDETTGKSFEATFNFGVQYYSNKYSNLASGIETILSAIPTETTDTTTAPATEETNE